MNHHTFPATEARRDRGMGLIFKRSFTSNQIHASILCMTRPKTISELRREIMLCQALKAESQERISQSLSLNQATLSRILRGQFKRRSKAVERVCSYAHISCITKRPISPIDASLEQLSAVARIGSPNARRAIRLIRLAAELLESE